MTGWRPVGERGSATVWMVAVSGVLAAVGAAVVLVGVAAVARHRAATAADLAALAGAGRAVRADPGACALATEVAAVNGAVVDRCATGPAGEVRVWVHVPVRLGPLGAGAAHARARAGPVPP